MIAKRVQQLPEHFSNQDLTVQRMRLAYVLFDPDFQRDNIMVEVSQHNSSFFLRIPLLVREAAQRNGDKESMLQIRTPRSVCLARSEVIDRQGLQER